MALNPPPVISLNLGLIIQPLRHSSVGRTAIVTAAVNNTGGQTALQVVNHWQTRFNADLAPFLDSNCTVEQPTINLGDGTDTPHQAIATGATVVGTIVNTMPPPQIAVLIKKSTGFGGKSNRGRMYMPWFTDELDLDEAGNIASTPLASKQTNATAFLGHLVTDSIPMVISNKLFAFPAPPAKPYVTHINMGDPVIALTVEGVVATQRRRLPR